MNGNTRGGGDVGGVAFQGSGGGANAIALRITGTDAIAKAMAMLNGGASTGEVVKEWGDVAQDGKKGIKEEVEAKSVSTTNDADGVGVEIKFGKKSLWSKFVSGLKSLLWQTDRSMEGSEIQLVTDRYVDKDGGGIEFTGKDGQNKEARKGGQNADKQSENVDEMSFMFGHGGSGGLGNFSTWFESYNNLMNAVDIKIDLEERMNKMGGAPQEDPFLKIGPNNAYIYVDTGGRNLDPKMVETELNKMQDSLWVK